MLGMVYSLLLSSPHILSTLSLAPLCLSTVQILSCQPPQLTEDNAMLSQGSPVLTTDYSPLLILLVSTVSLSVL